MSTIRFGDGTIRVRMGDWCWVRNRKLAGRYTCPLLLTLSAYVLRLRGKKVYWYLNMPQDRVFFGYAPQYPNKGYLVEASCIFPYKWIMAECNYWNWRNQRAFKRRQRQRG